MNLPFSFRQKIKIALFLFCIMVCSILIRLLEDKSLKNMGVAFTSIYNDRLIPTADLFQVSEHVMGKSQTLDFYLHQNHSMSFKIIQNKILKYDLTIDSLLKKYQSTYLINAEKDRLVALRRLIQYNRQLEASILLTDDRVLTNVETARYEQELNFSYGDIFRNLSSLIEMQSKVGEDLIKESQQLMVGSKLYSSLQFALAILIGVLILSILLTANVLKVKTDNFSLN